MITFPIAKINLGLNVVERRPDGYHNLQTVFYPVPIKDALEVFPMNDGFPSDTDCDLKVTNIQIEGDEQKNLVVRAYRLLKEDFPSLPRLHAHVWKGIPTLQRLCLYDSVTQRSLPSLFKRRADGCLCS